MVDPVTGPAPLDTQSLSSAFSGDKAMGRDAFLKLLVAQLKHQDPLKPQDGAEFVAELAQFSSVEQAMGVNSRLDMIASQMQGLANTEVTGLVGKLATVRGNMVTSDGSGTATPLAFTLSGNADVTNVVIRDLSGRLVRTIELGESQGGLVQTTWDGRDANGVLQPAGTYQVTVQAELADGAPVSVEQETSGIVMSVSFDKGYPVLELSNGIRVPVSDLLRVDTP